MTVPSATIDTTAATLADGPEATSTPAATLEVVDDPLEQRQFTRWVVGADGERLGESSLLLSGLHCAACSGIVEAALRRTPGVRWARVAAATQTATVCWDPALTRPSALIAAVRDAGYDAVPDAAAPARALRRAEARRALWRLFVAAFCAMQVMMLATPGYVADPGELAPDMRRLLNWASWVLTLPVLAFSSGPFFAGAWRGVRRGRIGMDVPVALGILITFVASTGATFGPGGPFGHEVYFDSLTMFVAFLLGARTVEMRARHRAAQAIEASLARLPETAERLEPDGTLHTVSVHRLMPGDRVRVPVGQAFAADGVVLEGRTQADEALLTGESMPVAKDEGAEVVAGSINLGAPVTMRVARVGGDTRYEAIVSMMKSAMSQRPAAARIADRWAVPFLWAVLVLAGGAAAVWSVVEPTRALWVAVAVLVVTCPCALSLAAPTTLVAAARAFARRGVVLQRLDAIEALARVDQVFFDKTGTLTEDRMALAATALLPAAQALEVDDDGVRRIAASLAGWSSHPLSQALLAAAAGAAGAVRWHDVEEVAGRGVQGRDERGRRWRLGAAAWVAAQDGDAPAASDADAQTWLGVDGRAVARFDFDEVLRPGAAEALRALQDEGVQVVLLSGDRRERAESLAARVGIGRVLAEATPQAKLDAVAAAQAAGRRVAMVGDGINDAPVLARADVSLAMGHGAVVARSQADAVITSGRIADVVAARASARRAMAIVRQNIAWAAAYNALGVPLAVAGWLPPWAAGLGMATSSIAVVLNALRAGR